MKERPILFSDEMVRAILEGRKTQTRRVVKQQDVLDSRNEVGVWDGPGEVGEWEVSRCPYGQAEDRLWVREAWAKCQIKECCDGPVAYRASWLRGMAAHCEGYTKWKPSIHLPRWASRITLEITGVRVERLQDISEADAGAEGIDAPAEFSGMGPDGPIENEAAYGWHPVDAFAELWDSINKDRGYSWESNPWVWVVNFKRIEA